MPFWLDFGFVLEDSEMDALGIISHHFKRFYGHRKLLPDFQQSWLCNTRNECYYPGWICYHSTRVSILMLGSCIVQFSSNKTWFEIEENSLCQLSRRNENILLLFGQIDFNLSMSHQHVHCISYLLVNNSTIGNSLNFQGWICRIGGEDCNCTARPTTTTR